MKVNKRSNDLSAAAICLILFVLTRLFLTVLLMFLVLEEQSIVDGLGLVDIKTHPKACFNQDFNFAFYDLDDRTLEQFHR